MKLRMFLILVFMCAGFVMPAQSYDTLPSLPSHYTKRVALFRAEKSSTGKVLFLGNSLTEKGNWRKMLKDSSIVNRGIAGDNTFGILNRLDEVVRFKPSKVFLQIGMDDLAKGIPTAVIIENIFTIVQRLHAGSSGTKIFVQDILPVNPGVRSFQQHYSKQDDIVAINKQLAKYAEALKYTFVDLHDSFLDEKKMLDTRYTTDGVQLNAAGYKHWLDILKKNKFL